MGPGEGGEVKILNVEQGSPAWVQARLGLPTASQFHRICTPGGKLSAASAGYMHELLAERLLGMPADLAASGFMERGKTMEREAIMYYQLQRGTDAERAGFVLTDDGRAGCSPDRLVGEKGGLELKCPTPKVHVSYLLDDISETHKPQVQGCIHIAEREWWDVMSYAPEFPPELVAALVRVERDDDYITILAQALKDFNEQMEEAWAKLSPHVGKDVAA